jgi:pimeloyl-ACP methyl ester carboxylesterase
MRTVIAPVVASIRLPSGLVLDYVEQGDPAGVPVLLLHGYTDSRRSFDEVLPLLPASIHAFALSQRGHGDSDRPAAGYRPHDYAADLTAFMDALGIEAAVIAGHSMGSSAAQRFAIDHPARCLGLALIASTTTWRRSPFLVDLWDSVVSTLRDPIDPAFVREFQASPRMSPALLEVAVQESLKLPACVWRAALDDLLKADFSEELGKIEAPALIVWGDEDVVAPSSEQEPLAAAIAGSRLVVYPGTGHGLHWEEPARFAGDLVAFVADVVG